jgi:hypothetical protein
MLDLSQVEACLGSYTTNPSAYVRQFQYLLQSYSLTYHDKYIILSNTLLPEKCRRVWEQARTLQMRSIRQLLLTLQVPLWCLTMIPIGTTISRLDLPLGPICHLPPGGTKMGITKGH